MSAPDTNVACVERILPPIFSFKEINRGIEPTISITANSVKVTVKRYSTLKFMGDDIYNKNKTSCRVGQDVFYINLFLLFKY
jgi:hypothetical protein